MTIRWKPHVTVAAIIEHNGRFLLVEEQTSEGLRLNNPAGHLDPGESPEQGCARETLEETAFQFTPNFLVGVYLSRPVVPVERCDLPVANVDITHTNITYLRFAFCGTLGEFDATRTLDTGITRTLWMTAEEINQNRHLLRSPFVLRCIEDYLKGQRYPLDLIRTDDSVTTLADA